MTAVHRTTTVSYATLAFSAAVLATVGAAATPTETIPVGGWEVRSTISEIDVPGLPGFLQRMAMGHTTTERKCVPPNQSVAALLAPDPKANCRVDRAQIGGGRYAQSITCPQKRGDPLTVTRAGTYDGNGFTGHATVNGTSKKGALHVTMQQRAVHTKDACKG